MDDGGEILEEVKSNDWWETIKAEDLIEVRRLASGTVAPQKIANALSITVDKLKEWSEWKGFELKRLGKLTTVNEVVYEQATRDGDIRAAELYNRVQPEETEQQVAAATIILPATISTEDWQTEIAKYKATQKPDPIG